MRFGSKGISAETVIFIILAIVIIAVVLYMFIFRGANPFAQQTDFTPCVAQLNSACGIGAGYINTGATNNVDSACQYIQGIPQVCTDCVKSGCSPDQEATKFESCCDWARGVEQR